MVARVLGVPEVGNHFSLKQDTLHWANGYEQSLLRSGVISSSVANLDMSISYQEFLLLLDSSAPGEETMYEFTRGDAAKILAEYLTKK